MCRVAGVWERANLWNGGEGRGCRGRGLVPLLGRRRRAKPGRVVGRRKGRWAGRLACGRGDGKWRAWRATRDELRGGDLGNEGRAVGLGQGVLFAARKRLWGGQAFALADGGQGRDGAAAAGQFGGGLDACGRTAAAALAGDAHAEPRELVGGGTGDGIAVGLARGEHSPGDRG